MSVVPTLKGAEADKLSEFEVSLLDTIVSRPARGCTVGSYGINKQTNKKKTRKTFIYLENKGNFKLKTPKPGGSDTHL